MERQLQKIRSKGWFVAVHNDYLLKGKRMTFWLFTNPKTRRFVKGEGTTDQEALRRVALEIRQEATKSPKG